jgi:hypothetical protein
MNAAGWTPGPEFPAHPRSDHRAPRIPTGRWARDHDACRGCGTTARPHHAGGRCTACYQRERMLAKRQARRAGVDAELRRLAGIARRCRSLTDQCRLELLAEIERLPAGLNGPTEARKRGSHG